MSEIKKIEKTPIVKIDDNTIGYTEKRITEVTKEKRMDLSEIQAQIDDLSNAINSTVRDKNAMIVKFDTGIQYLTDQKTALEETLAEAKALGIKDKKKDK